MEGSQESLRWNEILKHLSGLQDSRIKASLRKLDLDGFMVLKEAFDSVYLTHKSAELEERAARAARVKDFKLRMIEEGITLEDLSVPTCAIERRPRPDSDSEKELSPKEDMIMTVLRNNVDDDLVYRMGSPFIAEQCGENRQWVSNGLAKLKLKQYISSEGVKRTEYRLLK